MSASGLWVSTRCTRQKVKLVDKASLSYSTTSLPRNLFLYLNSAVSIKFHLRKFSQYLASLKTLHRGWNKALQALKWQCLHLPLWSQLHAWCLAVLLARGTQHLWTTLSAMGLCSSSLNWVQTLFPRSCFVFIICNYFSFVLYNTPPK